jgi:Uma2 family endonuclease
LGIAQGDGLAKAQRVEGPLYPRRELSPLSFSCEARTAICYIGCMSIERISERYIRNPGQDGDLSPFPCFRFTVPQFLEIIGLESVAGERFELINGWIVPTENKTPLNFYVHETLYSHFRQLASDRWMVRSQCSMRTPDSILEPDISIVKESYHAEAYCRYPTGSEVLLTIEVADRTLERDRGKAKIYAAAGVKVCWIVNLREQQVEVHDQLCEDAYTRVRVFAGSAPIAIELNSEMVGTWSCDQFSPDTSTLSPTDPT